MALERPALCALAEEEARLRLRTRHLTEIGKHVHSLALQLEAEKANDPLRHLLQGNRAFKLKKD